MRPRVLFVSKPIAPPFHDGTKCLVRDLARNLYEVVPSVMSTRGGAPLIANDGACPVRTIPVYNGSGGFSPGVLENLRAARFLLFSSRADVWHFVFAPNSRSSAVGRYLKALRRVPVVQTIASPPRDFESIERLLFGNIVVAQSRWTLERVEEAYERQAPGSPRPRFLVIPPPVPPIPPPSPDAILRLRHTLDIPPEAPVLVYPGDLETSRGAETVAKLVTPLSQQIRGVVVVFAYRQKTPEAPRIAERLKAKTPSLHTRFVSEVPDVLELVAGCRAVLFPVDDLRGKVDLPIVLLEAMDLGVPVLALDQGPLRDLEGAWRIANCEPRSWLDAIQALIGNSERRGQLVENQRRAVAECYRDRVVAERYERLYLDLANERNVGGRPATAPTS